ncbi:hypothetical protein [Chitinophaga filiformis]|uniref:Uncharacterized protein n=1 Tax=Chitinophaga filiformis TaxID=104663 RepID=A0ABY4I3W8_CHIFI|nr:hypothetical protein [Chitinophaga filiformis]UPK69436.1 hypothetical protein MYF79_31220 [Chitinophaga filiformis]
MKNGISRDITGEMSIVKRRGTLEVYVWTSCQMIPQSCLPSRSMQISGEPQLITKRWYQRLLIKKQIIMNENNTVEKLRRMHLSAMARLYHQSLTDQHYTHCTADELLTLLVDAEWEHRL